MPRSVEVNVMSYDDLRVVQVVTLLDHSITCCASPWGAWGGTWMGVALAEVRSGCVGHGVHPDP
eukprot:scaffold316287_cov32-Tisochrysis_lutea.AAC.4